MIRIYSARRRLLKRIVKNEITGCWLWAGRLDKDGYGKHRSVYQAFKGEIPEAMTLDHKCRVRACVNPDHLKPMSLKKNILRGTGIAAVNARKRKCNRGHAFSRGNTIRNKNGSRECRACKNLLNNRRRIVTFAVTPQSSVGL